MQNLKEYRSMWFTDCNKVRSRATLWLCFFISFVSTNAQITFSKRLPLISTTAFNSVQVLDNGNYLLSGYTLDSVPNYHFDFATSFIDPQGELISFQHFGDSSDYYHIQHHIISMLPDLFVQQGWMSVNDTMTGVVFVFNAAGDTVKTMHFQSPFNGEPWQYADFVNPRYSILMQDSSVYVTAGVVGETTANDVCIWHLDKDGNELWHYIYATEADPETCYAMIPWQGGVMAAIGKRNSDFSFDNDIVLVHLLEDGTENSIFDGNDWNNFSVYNLAMLVDNGKIICAGGISEAIDLNSRCAIWKLDESGALIWSSPIGDYAESAIGYNYFKNIVKVADGNYVGTNDFYTWDNGTHYEIQVIKCDSADGSLIWERFYHFVESESDQHSAIDLKATPDGGVVFCGHASDAWSQNPDLELPAQQGWIVKLDACGCLVPGCDINCVVEIEELGLEPLGFFKVGPNPASDYINIYLAPSNPSLFEIRNSTFVIHDMNGNEVKSFAPHRGDTTYIVDTQSMAAGEYIISLVSEGNVLQTERIVVAK